MKTKHTTILFLLIYTCCISQTKFNINYPETKKLIKRNNYHGVIVTDNYSWMDDVNSKEVISWTKLQDSTTRNFIGSFIQYNAIKEKVANLMQVSGKMDLPVKVNDNYFYIKDDQKGNWGFYRQKSGADPISLKLPFNARAIYFYVPSPDAKNIAIALAGPGGNFDWKIYNLETQKISETTLRGSDMGKTRLTWDKDSKGFYYLSSDKIDDKEVRGKIKIKLHKLGNNYENDKVVYSPESDGSKIEIDVTDDNKYLVIVERNGAASPSKVLYREIKDSSSKSKYLVADARASYIFLGNNNSTFYFETDLKSPSGKVVSIDINDSKSSWKNLIIEKDESIMGYQSAGGSLLPIIAGNRFVIPVQKDLKISLKIYNLKGKFERRIELPKGGLYFNMNGLNALSGSRNNEEILTRFIGITEPNTIFTTKVHSENVAAFDRAKVQFNADDYESKIVFCNSKDGTKVPISLTYKKGIKRDGKNPLMMQVYGAIAFTNYPYFQGDYIAWLEMGGIHAVSHIRGGGALGSKWHQDGIARNKQNGIDDYIASIEWVVEKKYTSSKKIVLNGVSAGTIPVAAVMTQRSDLVGAVVSHYGMLDMIGYAEKFKQNPSLAYMVPEIGRATNSEDFEALSKYSPYFKLDDKKSYPPILALTSDVDSPLNADSYKFIAKLQHNKFNKTPILLQMAWGSQHSGFGSASHSPILTFTDEITFLIKVLNIDVNSWLN